MRKLIAAALCAVMALAGVSSASAAVTSHTQFNKAYWPLQDAYIKALDAKDDAKIIETGGKITALFVGAAAPDAKAAEFTKNGDTAIIQMLYPVYINVAESTERLGDYDKTAQAFKNALPFAKAFQPLAQNPKDMDFAITQINNKIAKYGTDVSVYVKAEGGSPVYHGAKFEPTSGAYYGEAYSMASDHKTRQNAQVASLPKKAAGTLVYVAYETETMESFSWLFERLAKEYDIIEVAWNLVGENDSLKGVLNDKAKIEANVKYLSTLNVKILLRFGAEMNVWEKLANPADYIAAFKLVADTAHKYKNIATLWSPNAGSAQGATYEMYYPGDEYVDWVGISHYTVKYFLGSKNKDFEATYGTGSYANPVTMAKEIVEKYGKKKPIALSECGVENFSVTNNEDTYAWAEPLMRAVYAYLPMIYPEIKAVFYFDTYVSGTASRFSLYTSSKANLLYAGLTVNDYLISKGKASAGVTYKSAEGAKVSAKGVRLYTHAPFYSLTGVSVEYALNGRPLGTADAIPYEKNFDFSGYGDGKYQLTATVKQGGKTIKTAAYTMTKTGAEVLLTK